MLTRFNFPQTQDIVDNFEYLVLHNLIDCGKLSTTTNEKKPPTNRRLRISDIRKRATNTIAELRIPSPYPAAPLRIWLIHTLIVSKKV